MQSISKCAVSHGIRSNQRDLDNIISLTLLLK